MVAKRCGGDRRVSVHRHFARESFCFDWAAGCCVGAGLCEAPLVGWQHGTGRETPYACVDILLLLVCQ